MEVACALEAQRGRIASACARVGRREDEVDLVAVSKGHGLDAMIAAYDTGQRAFGESYVQEFTAKRATWPADRPGVEWHFIGHLQTNKAKEIAEAVALIHAVDRPSLVDALARRVRSRQRVLVEVNVAGESSKAGCAPEDAAGLVEALRATRVLEPVGLMTMAPFVDDPEDVRWVFSGLRALRDRIRESVGEGFGHLSMGMSGDLEVAVEEGATIVRVGTAIFGQRQ